MTMLHAIADASEAWIYEADNILGVQDVERIKDDVATHFAIWEANDIAVSTPLVFGVLAGAVMIGALEDAERGDDERMTPCDWGILIAQALCSKYLALEGEGLLPILDTSIPSPRG